MRKRLQMKALIILVILAVFLTGVQGIRWVGAHLRGQPQIETAGSGERISGGTLHVGIPGPISTLDPHQATEPAELAAAAAVTDPLFNFDPLRGISGAAAQSWQIEDDGLTYMIHLRSDLKFTDGTDCDAETVVFNLRRMSEMGPPILSEAWLGAISDITAVDELTVRLDLRYPDANLLFNLSRPQTGLVSREAVLDWEDEFAAAPVGLGPFMVPDSEQEAEMSLHAQPQKPQDAGDVPAIDDPDWEQAGSVTMRAYSHYWRGSPHLDAVTFSFLDPQSSPGELLQGDFDVVVGNSGGSGAPGDSVEIIRSPRLDHHLLALNLSSRVLADVKVRQALDLIVDRQELIDQAVPGEASIINIGQTPFCSPDSPEDDAEEDDEARLQQAQNLLAEADFDPAEPLHMLSDSAEHRVAVSSLIAQQLRRAGIEVKLEVVDDREEYYHRMRAGEYDISYWVLLPGVADLSGYTANMRSDSYWNVSQIWNSPSNDAGRLKGQIDELLSAAAVSSDASGRQKMLEEFFSLAQAEQLFISLYHSEVLTVHTDRVSGIHHPYAYYVDFFEAHFLDVTEE